MRNVGLLSVGIVTGVVGLPLGSYFLVFQPQDTEITRAKQEVDHMRSLLRRLQEEVARNADFEAANQELQRSIALIERRLPTNEEIDSVIRQVSDLAVGSGLAPPSITNKRPVPAGLYMELPLDMETEGTFLGYHTFLAQLEKLPRVMRIHDMKVEENRSGSAGGSEVKARFTLSIYFQDEGRPVASAGTR